MGKHAFSFGELLFFFFLSFFLLYSVNFLFFIVVQRMILIALIIFSCVHDFASPFIRNCMILLYSYSCMIFFSCISLAQMSRFYSLIWNEMASSKKTTAEEFHLQPFVFVPYDSSFRHEDVVYGTFLSPEEVYWDDSTFFVDQIKEIHSQCSSTFGSHGPVNKILSNFYPPLHDFFVDICGIHEIPPLRSYLQIMLQFSNAVLPSQAANAVSTLVQSNIVTSQMAWLPKCFFIVSGFPHFSEVD